MRGNRLLVAAALPLSIAGIGRGNAVSSEEQQSPSATSGSQEAASNRPRSRTRLAGPSSGRRALAKGRSAGNTLAVIVDVLESGTALQRFASRSRARFGPTGRSTAMRIMFLGSQTPGYAFDDIMSVFDGRAEHWGSSLFPAALDWLDFRPVRSSTRSFGGGPYGGSRYYLAGTMDVIAAEMGLWPTTTAAERGTITFTVGNNASPLATRRSTIPGTSADAAGRYNALQRLKVAGRRQGAPSTYVQTTSDGRMGSPDGSAENYEDFHWSNIVDFFLTQPPYSVPGPLTLVTALAGATGIVLLVLRQRMAA